MPGFLSSACFVKPNEHLHHGERGVVTADPGEVVLQHGQGAGQSHMAAAAEQCHA